MIPVSNVDYVRQEFTARLGNPYVYGGCYSRTDTSQGADCSYVSGWVLEGLTNGPATMNWGHMVSTESWSYDYDSETPAYPGTVGPYGTIAVPDLASIPATAALIINIMHGGGGEDSHMSCVLPDGTIMESNGDYGTCTNGTGAYPSTASLWTDHWYLPGDTAPTSPPVSATSYIVQPGDTLSTIADNLGVTLETLEMANPQISDFNTIYPGQVINT